MIYLLIVCAVAIILFLFVYSEHRTVQMASMFLMLFFFMLSLCFFILYFCKSSFNLSAFQKYFQVPRSFAAKLYFLKISREAVIIGLNVSCILFTAANLFFASSFLGSMEKRAVRRYLPVFFLFFIVEYLVCSPGFYIHVYSFLNPQYMSPSNIETMWEYIGLGVHICNFLILLFCFKMVLTSIIRAPRIKIYRMPLITIFISYSMLISCFLMLMGQLPRQMIRYAKEMNVVTYKMLFVEGNVPLYRAFPYVVFLLIILLVIWSLRLNRVRAKMEDYSLEVSKNINAVNLSTSVFCHFIKNELLNLQAEAEALNVTEDAEEDKEMFIRHCDALYDRLDDIHLHIKDNTMNFRQHKLGVLVEKTVKDMELSHQNEDIAWIVDVSREDSCVFVDEEYLRQALINLINNACEALQNRQTAEEENFEGKICVKVLSDHRWGIIEVSDNGCGIPEENLVNIFSPFFTSKPMTKSWGMGLPLTHKIITDSGGKIDVESKVGAGTVFHVYLPVSHSGKE